MTDGRIIALAKLALLGDVDASAAIEASEAAQAAAESVSESAEQIATNTEDIAALQAAMPSPSDATPQDLGTAAAGTSADYSRADHVHTLPSEIAQIPVLQGETSANSHAIANIESLLNGALSVQQTDSTAAYSKDVPSKAQPYAAIDMVGGKTVVWNQLVSLPQTSDYSDNSVTIVNNGDGSITINGTASARFTNYPLSGNTTATQIPYVAGHKYIFVSSATLESTFCFIGFYNGSSWVANGEGYQFGQIYTISGNQTANGLRLLLDVRSGATFSNQKVYIYVTDLTILFGAGNEPSTVAEFTAMFPASFYAFNAGTLKSAGVTGAVSYSKNQLPLVTDMTTVSSNGITVTFNADGSYNINGTYTADANLTIIRNLATPYVCQGGYFHMRNDKVHSSLPVTLMTEGPTTEWMVFYSNTNTDRITAIPTSNIGMTYTKMSIYVVRNVQYDNITIHPSIEVSDSVTPFTPYRAPITLPIPSAVQSLPGYGWSAGTAYNYIDWQRKVYVQNVASVNLGTLLWTYYVASGHSAFRAILDGVKQPPTNVIANIVCPIYESALSVTLGEKIISIAVKNNPSNVYVVDSTYTDAATFTSAMSGVMLYYELATPVITDISSLLTDDNLLAVEPGGTVSFPSVLGDDYRIPVPSTEEYTIDMAPDAPTTDGTYTLQCTVADGVATYEWVSA